MTFRNGDLIPVDDAAELIDSAQDAAKKLARCCAEKDAEIARLREAIRREAERHRRAGVGGQAARRVAVRPPAEKGGEVTDLGDADLAFFRAVGDALEGK